MNENEKNEGVQQDGTFLWIIIINVLLFPITCLC